MPQSHSTTILAVRRDNTVAIGGDGQVTYGDTVLKADTTKIRKLLDGQVLVGFAGSTADAFALLERFEARLKDYPGNIPRAATELARDWRTDRVLRRLDVELDPPLVMMLDDELHRLLWREANEHVVAKVSGQRSGERGVLSHSDHEVGVAVGRALDDHGRSTQTKSWI